MENSKVEIEGFDEVDPAELENSFNLIGKDWTLICTNDGEKANAMTASWGCFGVLWRKNICMFFLRPQRYTYSLLEKEDLVSLNFFSEQYKDKLRYFGTKSGRDTDKFADTDMSYSKLPDGTPYVKEANIVLCCRKLYTDDIKKANFVDTSLL